MSRGEDGETDGAKENGRRYWGRGDRSKGNPIKSKFGAEGGVIDHEVSKILVTTETTTRIQIVETLSQ